MYSYATLAELLQQNDAVGGTAAPSDAQTVLLAYARRATQVIESGVWCDQWFVPLLDTRYYAVYPRDHISMYYNTLKVNDPLCSVTAVAIGDTTLTSTDYRLFPYNETPVYEVQRKRSTGTWLSYASADDLYAVTGVWCYRRRYDTEGWINSGDVVKNTGTISASATSLTVTSTTGADADQYSPRFSAGQLIRMDSEYSIVTATTATTATLIRGARGTTAASHDENTIIYTFKVQPEIVEACMLIAAFNFNNAGNYTRVAINTTTGVIEENIEVPQRAIDILNEFRKKIVIGF